MKKAILLLNLGTPEEATTKAIRRYLREFLSDKRVIDAPSIVWKPILYGFILPFRPKSILEAYESIWWPEGSPLRVITEKQSKALQQRLSELDEDTIVTYAMNYGLPSIQAAMDELLEQGVDCVTVIPLYPQYSASTVAACYDALAAYFQKKAFIPELNFINGYHRHPQYIQALANSIYAHWQEHGKLQRLLFSFHGIPKRYVEKGDPYPEQCHATAKLVAETLQLTDDEWMVTFQSRFGPAEWVKPYTMDTLQALPGQGVESVDIISPGFAADCLETLEELAMQNRDAFVGAGGKEYRYIPALNDHPDHIELLSQLAR